jgi:hypothetical protein
MPAAMHKLSVCFSLVIETYQIMFMRRVMCTHLVTYGLFVKSESLSPLQGQSSVQVLEDEEDSD